MMHTKPAVCWRQADKGHGLLEPCPVVWCDQDKLIWFRWCQAGVAATRWGVQRQVCLAYSQALWWECPWSGAAWVQLALGSYSSLREPWMPHELWLTEGRAWFPPFGDWAAGQYSTWQRPPYLATEAEGKDDGLAKHVSRAKPYWASVRHPQMKVEERKFSLHPPASVMSSWRSGKRNSSVNLWSSGELHAQ